MEETKTANEALENIGKMAQEMEERYEDKIELLQFQFEDACKMAERYLVKNKELEVENEELVYEVGSMITEAQEARRSFTAFQLAVSILIFLYGMMYGQYFRC
jgi:hypothetical protein